MSVKPPRFEIPLTDGKGVITRPWYTFLWNVGGLPGGSTNQVQYNNAGAFGGNSGFTYDGTNVTLTGNLLLDTGGVQRVVAINGAADPYIEIDGDLTSEIYLQCYEPTTGGADIYTNKARGSFASPASVVAGDRIGGHSWWAWNSTGFQYGAQISAFVQTVNATYIKAKLTFRTADGTVDADIERGYFDGDGGFVLGSPTGSSKGAGTINATGVYTNGVQLNGATTVASLPAASGVAYARTFVTDASAPTFGSTVTGGGAVKTPVWSNGTNWIVG